MKSLIFLSASQKCIRVGIVYPYKIKIKWFWKYHFLNYPKIQELLNKIAVLFLSEGENMNLFSSVIFHHIKSLNERWVACLVQSYVMGNLNPLG